MTTIASRRAARRGFSLVEMIAVMGTMTIVLGLSVALLEMLLKLNASGREHLENEASIARAARVFRDDVRSASAVERCTVGADSTALALETAGEDVVEYQIMKDALVRALWRAGELMAQERFRLPAGSSARFEHREAGGRSVVALVFDRRGKIRRGEGDAHPFRIEATLGAMLRFAGEGGVNR